MPILRGSLGDIQFIPSTVGPLYTNPSATKTFIAGFTLFNTNNVNENIKIYIVPASGGNIGTAGLANQITEISLTPLETFIFEFPGDGAALSNFNDTVQGVTTNANKVNLLFHGLKEV